MAEKKKAGSRKKAPAKKPAAEKPPAPRVRVRRGSAVGGTKVEQEDGSFRIMNPQSRPMWIASCGNIYWYIEDGVIYAPPEASPEAVSDALDAIEADPAAVTALANAGASRSQVTFASYTTTGHTPRRALAQHVRV